MYQVCTRCVMDTSDPDIRFDATGICSHCLVFDELQRPRLRSGADGERALKALVDTIQSQGQNKRYDSIIGLSGGVDSSYVALKTRELGLRPLAIHVDTGWNSELAVSNI